MRGEKETSFQKFIKMNILNFPDILWSKFSQKASQTGLDPIPGAPFIDVITFYFHYNMWGCLCSTDPFQYRWLKRYVYSSCYYHHQIGSIHLSNCYQIVPWLCVWDVCYIIFCYLLHIHSGKTGNLFSLLLFSLWRVQIVRYVLTWRSYSFICTLHHLIIIIVQAYLKTLIS